MKPVHVCVLFALAVLPTLAWYLLGAVAIGCAASIAFKDPWPWEGA